MLLLQQSPPSNWHSALLFSSSQYPSSIQMSIQPEFGGGPAVVGDGGGGGPAIPP